MNEETLIKVIFMMKRRISLLEDHVHEYNQCMDKRLKTSIPKRIVLISNEKNSLKVDNSKEEEDE